MRLEERISAVRELLFITVKVTAIFKILERATHLVKRETGDGRACVCAVLQNQLRL